MATAAYCLAKAGQFRRRARDPTARIPAPGPTNHLKGNAAGVGGGFDIFAVCGMIVGVP